MDKIEVTQADRDFAANYLFSIGTISERSAKDIKAGDWDETRHVLDVARHRLATRTDATPTCWLYRNSEGHTCVQFVQGLMDLNHWTETPLYPDPPATDVAALVEAAKEAARGFDATNALVEAISGSPSIMVETFAERLRQALAPFTKGQNDDG